MAKDLVNSNEYHTFLVDIKNQIKLSQQKAFNAVNQEMILLYCNIGEMIDIRQKELGWGAKVIDKLSLDILTEFPDMSGFSTRNLKRMVRFYKEYKDEFEKVPLSVAQFRRSKYATNSCTNISCIHKKHSRICKENCKILTCRG